ncbi:hypothetical protein S40285_06783 [Stachybotrys chlorohalonatus IBT 40285]|uniref:PCI domain-containing protein n=1 Tax=Stachybotrys chlorohalonatus (strain IBT 40285) TaxID=1283841 RepID=A0A084QDQ6_STAC4|nr:hypothetical protein S40285_06783 [Stachybotrys chlorohalonata IBT 40285]
MEQTKALNALEPFLALSKSATSPRAAADLVTRATSAPNTFIFAELLQTPPIQALAESPEHKPYLKLLEIFSYGTYQAYQETPDLPALSDAQLLKLRQLSLLSLARDRDNLSYAALQKSLGLTSTRQLEDLVISAVYAGLLHATLDPAREAVQLSSVAPLRDLQPGSIPQMLSILNNWSERCDSTLGHLDDQIKSIRAAAAARETQRHTAEKKMQALVTSTRDAEKSTGKEREPLSLRKGGGISKRSMGDVAPSTSQERMDVDELVAAEEAQKRATKRKM